MRLLLNKRLHINMGNYEHVETVATVEVDTEKDAELLSDMGLAPDHLDSVKAFMSEEIESLLASDVEDAHYMTDEPDSFVHEYHKQHHQKEKR